jgi:hypothetical protein
VGDQDVGVEGLGDADVGGVVVGGLEDDVARGRLDADQRGEVLEAHALEAGAEHRPAGDAVDVERRASVCCLAEQGGPVELGRALDLAVDLEPEVG